MRTRLPLRCRSMGILALAGEEHRTGGSVVGEIVMPLASGGSTLHCSVALPGGMVHCNSIRIGGDAGSASHKEVLDEQG